MIFLLHQEVSLYLSPLRRQKSSAPLAVFTIPALSTTWNRLAVQVRHLLRPYQPPTWTWKATFLPWASWEVFFVYLKQSHHTLHLIMTHYLSINHSANVDTQLSSNKKEIIHHDLVLPNNNAMELRENLSFFQIISMERKKYLSENV